MSNDYFSKIFVNVYQDLLTQNDKDNIRINIPDMNALEETLENYILNVMGYPVLNKYRLYKQGRIEKFEYFREVRIYFENIFRNCNMSNVTNVITHIKNYDMKFTEEIEKNHYVNLLINGIKKTYSYDINNVAILNSGKSYTIIGPTDKFEHEVPAAYIRNIDELNKILEKYIAIILNSDSFFKETFSENSGNSYDEAIEYILIWTLKNASVEDLNDLENYFSKYCSFITDDSLDCLKEKPILIGDFMGDQLYAFRKKSTVVYETPYYLAFMLKNKMIELPNVRLGIEDLGDKKIAHILATQTSQNVMKTQNSIEIDGVFKKMLPKSSYFREFNPSHLVSLVITIGFLNKIGIKDIVATEFLPLRFQKLVMEGNKSDEELYNYQHRLTNKFSNNFFRMIDYSDGIEITRYPGDGPTGTSIQLKLSDEIIWENEFLKKLYMLGYNIPTNTLEKEKNI